MLKKKILITLGLLSLYWLGRYVPIPGIDYGSLTSFPNLEAGLGFVKQLSIFKIGVASYVTAHIIMLFVTFAIPGLKKLYQEGANKRINQYIILLTVLLVFIQGYGLSFWIQSQHAPQGIPLVSKPGPLFQILTAVTIAGGAMFLVVIGTLITNYGIGNGISLIFLLGVAGGLPRQMAKGLRQIFRNNPDSLTPMLSVIAVLLFIFSIASVLKAERKIPVQNPQQKKERAHISLSFNQAGTIPVIFAIAVLSFPHTLALSFKIRDNFFIKLFQPGAPLYYLLYAVLVVFFSYLCAAIIFDPKHLAGRMKKLGLAFSKVRSDKVTVSYLDKILEPMVLIWGIFLVGIFLLPDLLNKGLDVRFSPGGWTLICIVAIGLGTWLSLVNGIKFREVFRHQRLEEILAVKAFLETKGIKTTIDSCEAYGGLLCLPLGPLAEKRLLLTEGDHSKAKELLKNI
jgi:preprotein translocase subunit SecY